MKNKRLLIILVVVLGLTLLVWFINRPRVSVESAAFFEAIKSPQKVDRVSIARGERLINLKKAEDKWKVNDRKADPKQIEAFFKSLVEAKLGDLVSRNKEFFSKFQIDGKQGYHFLFFERNKTLADFYVGKQAADYKSAYFRIADKDGVYVLYSGIRRFAAKSEDDWRDKTIVKIGRNSIRRINYSYPRESFSLERIGEGTKESWSLKKRGGKQKNLSKEALASLLGSLVNLSAASFPRKEEMNKLDFSRSRTKIKLTADGEPIEILFIADKKNKNEYFVKKQGDKTIFKINAYKALQILRKAADF